MTATDDAFFDAYAWLHDEAKAARDRDALADVSALQLAWEDRGDG